MADLATGSQYVGSGMVVIGGLSANEWTLLTVIGGFILGVGGFMVNYLHKRTIRIFDLEHKKTMARQDKWFKEQLLKHKDNGAN